MEVVYEARPEKVAAFKSCRSQARFMRNTETGAVRVAARTCHIRFCPLCGRARARRVADGIAEWLRPLPHRTLLTLTLQSADLGLDHQLAHLVSSFRRLRRLPAFAAVAKGGVWFVQVTRNAKTGLWHPHLHIVGSIDWIEKRQLSKLWADASAGSTIVDIHRIRRLTFGASYAARYVARPAELADLPDAAAVELVTACQGVHMLGAFGSAHSAGVLRRPKYDPALWECVGSWSTVVSLLGCHDAADAIWTAWQSAGTLAAGTSLIRLELEIDGYGVLPPPRAAPSAPSLFDN